MHVYMKVTHLKDLLSGVWVPYEFASYNLYRFFVPLAIEAEALSDAGAEFAAAFAGAAGSPAGLAGVTTRRTPSMKRFVHRHPATNTF